MSEPWVVITGATGNVGGELARRLLDRGKRVRAVGRSEERLTALVKAGAEAAVGDLADPAFTARACAGAGAVFAMIPPSYGEPDFRAYQNRVAEALATGVEKGRVPFVVTLSSVGAQFASGVGPIAGLYDLEQRLNRAAGTNVVHLRPAFFLENHLFSLGLIREKGINGSALRPDLAIPMIATCDIAAAAADLLTGKAPAGKVVRELLGPREYTMPEATRILGAAIGRPDLAYVPFGYDDVRQALLGLGMSADAAGVMVDMYRGFNEGRVRPTEMRSGVNSTATTLEAFARDVFAPAFTRA